MNIKKQNLKKVGVIVVIVLICVAILFVGIYIGWKNRPAIDSFTGINSRENPVEITTDFEPFWKAWKILNEKYAFPATTTTDQDRVWGAVQGLASSYGDPYTVFFPPVESKAFDEEISGNFQGVGMEIAIKDGVLTVVAPLKGSPAEKSGIRSGDKIVKIGDRVTSDLTVENAVKLIRGEKGTTVKLSVVREGVKEPQIISIIRDIIVIPTVDTETKNGVFIIKLYNFSAMSEDKFRSGLQEFINSGKDRLIIDLRNNPGGYLDSAVGIASWFLPSGKEIVIEDFGAKKEQFVHRSRGYNVFNDNLKLAVLINGGSASASEILAGALRDHGLAKLIGERSFGKGSVQELVKVTSDTSLKVTVAKWLTPKGLSISDNGLVPDIEVKRTQEDYDKKLDPQLDKAIEYLNRVNQIAR